MSSAVFRKRTPRKRGLFRRSKNADPAYKSLRDESAVISSPFLTISTLTKTVDQVFPDIIRCKLKNEFEISWTGLTGAVNGFASLGNGLHLSNTSSAGGVISGANPVTVGATSAIYGLPNLIAIYNNYRIICTRVNTLTTNTSAATIDSAVLSIMPVTPTQLTNLGNVNTWNSNIFDEYTYSHKVYISGSTVNTGVTTSHCMHSTKMFGLRHPLLLEAIEYAGSNGANPTQLYTWVFGWFPKTGNTTSATTLVRLEYEMEFFSRSNLSTGSV
jgi:hypothetical protein